MQARVRLLDVATGATLRDRVVDGPQRLHLVAGADGHVVAAPDAEARIVDQRWVELDTGRFRSGAEVLGRHLPEVDDQAVLRGFTGRSPATAVFGRTPDPTDPALAGARLLADDAVAVRVGPTTVTAVEPTGAEVRWRVPADVVLVPEQAVLLEDRVVVLDVTGALHALRRSDGGVLWTTSLSASVLTAGGERLVVGTRDGRVLVLDDAGRVAQEIVAGSDPVEGVAVLDGVVVASVGADLVAFGRGAVVVEPDDRVEVP